LTWLLSQGDDLVPIPGTTSLARLEENVGAPAVHLSKADLERIDSVAPHGVATGERYHPEMMRLLNG
jgi:aryl-alcohol dehydrogenase-like predicted oxidoreductase